MYLPLAPAFIAGLREIFMMYPQVETILFTDMQSRYLWEYRV